MIIIIFMAKQNITVILASVLKICSHTSTLLPYKCTAFVA